MFSHTRLRPLVAAAILPMLAIVLPASGATVRKRAPAPAAPNTAIIPLPLNPIVPAGQRLCSATTPTGLGYTVLRAGSGTMPAKSDVVLINYVGYLKATGAVFDQNMRAPLPVDGVIPGFSQGLQMMARNAVVRFCIPATLGYGAQASGPIPANSDLVFQVELLDYKTAAEVEQMRAEPPAAAAAAPAPQPATPPKP